MRELFSVSVSTPHPFRLMLESLMIDEVFDEINQQCLAVISKQKNAQFAVLVT